uniref:Uncharacterized protein n=1 Tax=Siphoviridae sp. cttFh17 TaxID=2826491 RepID=A0A8S5NJM6_9CAUD|nr:MAG TPA: hypothetical protein [Siphoviridae sp. cttFh17]
MLLKYVITCFYSGKSTVKVWLQKQFLKLLL